MRLSALFGTAFLRFSGCVISLSTLFPLSAAGDTIRYTASPNSYPAVTPELSQEFGTANFPPLIETAQTRYVAEGNGPVNIRFRFKGDTGTFMFSFGYYHITPQLNSIDLSTDTGKFAYATLALAPSNAVLVFNDVADDPGITRTFAANGGDLIGFFLIPDASLQQFQNNPNLFAVNGFGSATINIPPPFRFPLFSISDVNPGGFDQLMSFSGTSAVTGQMTNLFAWEDLARANLPGSPFGSDSNFHDLIFAIEGIRAVPSVPEPSTICFLISALFAGVLMRRRKPVQSKSV